MELLRSVIVVVHLIGFAMILGPLLLAAGRKRYEFTAVGHYGLVVALVSGVFLFGSWGGYEPNVPKVAVKAALLVVLGGLLGAGSAKAKKTGEPVPAGLFWGAVALAVAICSIAVIW
ncbi:MAG: Fe-S protein [Gordonia sp. (in: high G+C Gram-positive bacteria)]|uniref:Fe-S protein n=1 Tax=Gordonia sp. (in: high G+C Gram-positive bacteria) TaxID=84139 RepID=UPI0039E588DF